MLKSVTLANFRSFGREVEVPLEPLTVIVGPNNSGKSAFASAFDFLRQVLTADAGAAITNEGGPESLVHRPGTGDGRMVLGWSIPGASYRGKCRVDGEGHLATDGEVILRGEEQIEVARSGQGVAFVGIEGSRRGGFGDIFSAMASTGVVRPNLAALRSPCVVEKVPTLLASGEGLAALVHQWHTQDDPRSKRLDEYLGRCVPEIQGVRGQTAKEPGKVELAYPHRDGQRFVANDVSDGVLLFTAWAAYLLALESTRSVPTLVVDEPEIGLHPSRLRHVVDFAREFVAASKAQLVLITHSPTLLDAFRDEPEAILVFRRGSQGTEVRRCSDLPPAMEALDRGTPGDLLENAIFEGLAWPP